MTLLDICIILALIPFVLQGLVLVICLMIFIAAWIVKMLSGDS